MKNAVRSARAPVDQELLIGRADLSIADVLRVARGEVRVALDPEPRFRARLGAARAAVERQVDNGGAVYGVTTGVGASVTNKIPPELRAAMPVNLTRFHGCGTGRILDADEAAAVVAIRLVSLARGNSGVRVELLERLCDFLNLRLLPRIPAEGSVGASGDLTPLSYLAAAVLGEREVTLGGEVLDSGAAHTRCGLEPVQLAPKESLSLMNGTSVMTALACFAVEGAVRLARLAAAVTAVAVDTTHGNPGHFDPRIFALKPHPGQTRCASWIRADLAGGRDRPPARLQDRYSLRCAPHVVGVLLDSLDFGGRVLEIEINGVDDNPMIDPDNGDILHGGNFYGGHVAMVMDTLKTAVANVADLLDRQLMLLCAPETSDGLPANLVASQDVLHHGFKAMQISASALTAEALKLCMPASVFSRSTESHNQDKVSMGTIAARDCLRVLELSETVAAIATLAVAQAVDLRGAELCAPHSVDLRDQVRRRVAPLAEDRRQDHDIAAVLELCRGGDLLRGRD